MERESILISNLVKHNAAGKQRISAEVDGEIVWFDFPDNMDIEARGELFIAAGLLEAMISNLPIKLDDNIQVSPQLLHVLDELQDIYLCWNRDLSKIKIQANNIQAPLQPSKGVGSFYSGGVDGSYTFCKHQNEITHLITLAGFDTVAKLEQWTDLMEKHQKFADDFNVELVVVNNNLRQFMDRRKISYFFQYGLTLGGIAISLGFEKVYIASSYTYNDLFPSGSHPSTDPLWSIENRQVIHDGTELSRSDKIKFIGRNQRILDNLQVCWDNISYNCDTCSKCLRTRAALHIFNLTSKSLKPLGDITELKSLSLKSHTGLPFIEDLASKSHEAKQPQLEKFFKGMIRKYLLRYYLEGFVKTLLGSQIKALVHKVKKTDWKEVRVTMEGHKNK